MSSNIYAKVAPQQASSGGGVTSLNSETGAVVIVAGTGVSVTPAGQNITIAATGGGDVTLAAVGSSPNANAATLASQVLNLEPASGFFPGVITTGAQTIAGAKTFSSTIVGSISGNAATVTTNANLTGDVTSVGNATTAAASQTNITSIANLATVGTITSGTWSATTVALNKGGTGQTTAGAAFNALSPMTTGGDLIYGGASGAGTRLANGSAGQVLTSAGTTLAPTWSAAASGTVTSVAASVPSVLSISGSPITTSGTLAISYSGTALPVANGGTALTSGTSGGVLAYTASGTIASSAALAQYAVVLGGGAGAVPATLATDSSTTKYLKSGGSSANPAWTAFVPPVVQRFTSGTAQTYTMTAGTLWQRVTIVGPGGGGSSSGTAAWAAGANGSADTSFASLVAPKGSGAPTPNNNNYGGTGGGAPTSTGATYVVMSHVGATGAPGCQYFAVGTQAQPGGEGGQTPLGGAGAGSSGSAAGGAAQPNTGSGGGGASTGAGVTGSAGGGGGCGAFLQVIYSGASLVTSTTYTVGAGGAGGAAGTNGYAGGDAAAGCIIVEEYFGP